jgi:pimeloyl-ACP methyl ester carboxylesterase
MEVAVMRAWVVVTLLVVAGCAGAQPERTLPLAPCAIAGLNEEAQCGVLDVLENRADHGGRRIPIHVAVLPARAAAVAPDPLVVLAGGPGQGARSYAGLFASTFRSIRRQRDLVFVDLRGTGDSAPLNCPDRDGEPLLWRFVSADTDACLRSLDADVRFYTHEEALQDLEAVRAALGYERVNLWGGSYGTRAALLYALAHPERVRTVTLDGAVPLEQRFPLSTAADGQRALDLLVERCARDAACHGPFPKVAADIAELFDQLRQPYDIVLRNPLTGRDWRITLDWRTVGSALRSFLYSPRLTALMPHVIHRAARGDWAPFFAMLAEISSGTTDTMALGMTLSVLCTEDVPRIDPREAADAVHTSWMGRAEIGWWRESCAAWPRHDVPPVYSTTHAPLQSPALILSGDADPATPPRWGDAMTRHFAVAQHVVVRAAHNTSFTGCVPSLIAQFVERGTGEPLDTRCLDAIAWPTFTAGPEGPRP